jgi:hypothetical protein
MAALGTPRTRRFIIASAMLAGAVTLLSAGLTRATPVSSAHLGPEWQCHRTALLLTSCSRIVHAEPAIKSAHHPRICLRQA